MTDQNKHDKDARQAGKEPLPQKEIINQKKTEKGSGEGLSGMQRGAGHPTGR